MKRTLTDKEREDLLYSKRTRFNLTYCDLVQNKEDLEKLENDPPKFLKSLFRNSGWAFVASTITSFGGMLATALVDKAIRLVKHNEIEQAEQAYVNEFTNGIYAEYGVTITPDANTITQQLMDYFVTVPPADMALWQEMANTFQIEFNQIAIDCGALTGSHLLIFILVGAAIPYVVNFGFNIFFHVVDKRIHADELHECKKKIYYDEQELMVLQQDIEALEKGEMPLNL